MVPGGRADRGPVGQHDHDGSAGHLGREPPEQAGLRGGQVDMHPVESFGLRVRGQAEEADGHVGAGRGPQRLLSQGLSPGRVLRAGAQGESGGEPESRRGQRPGQLVQRDIHLGGADLGAASALEPRGAGELAEHRDGQAGRVLQRQRAAVVLQQHEALRGRAAGQRMVRPGVRVRRAPGPGPQHQPEHPGHRLVEHRLREPPGGHRGDDGPVAEPQVGRHLQVQPGGQCGDPVMHRAPVRHDQPVEAPLVPEHLGQQPPVLRRVLAVDLVVGAHHRPRPGFA